MERAVFMIEESGARIGCLLNPESVVISRRSGLRPRSGTSGLFTRTASMDDPLLFTGGGQTELDLQLLFDVEITAAARESFTDVREMTRPLMMMAENSHEEQGQRRRPPLVRFIWGKAWNIPGMILAAAERFDQFSITGVPERSWMTLKLRRLADSDDESFAEFPVPRDPATIDTEAVTTDAIVTIGDGEPEPTARPDLIAFETLGNPLDWRLIAIHNELDSPFDVPPGTVLEVPRVSGRPATPPPESEVGVAP